MSLEIIANGDSWTFGCEIVSPELAHRYGEDTYRGKYDYLEENDAYRVPKIWTTHLGELLNANVHNLSWPADDNGTILNRTIDYITKHYIVPKKRLDNLLVIVGWSSPERNFFWYKDSELSTRFRIWPNVPHFEVSQQEDIWKLYVNYLWNKEEFLPRFVMNNLLLQSFCESHKIKWLCYNSFYQVSNSDINRWEDLNISRELSNIKLGEYIVFKNSSPDRQFDSYDYKSIWKTINPIRFYNKDVPNNTFLSFIKKNGKEPILNGWHPSPSSHKLWAEELTKYLINNKLI
jgi:hypothetical protein